MTTEPDYVTINRAVGFQRFNTVIMKYNPHRDEYFVFRISEPLKQDAAESLAKSWAAAMGLEMR